MVNKVIVIVGSGPGLGVSTGSLFASKGFDVALLSRNTQRLEQDVAVVRKANPNVSVRAYSVDVGDHIALPRVLAEVRSELGAPEVVYFNAARVQTSRIGETTPEYILEDFKSMNIGMYVAAMWAIPDLTAAAERPGSHPSFLFCNSGLWDHPIADFFSLSMQKASQYNLASSLNQILGPSGVHVAGVNIAGIIRDDDPVVNARNIANSIYELYEQDKAHWQFEIKVGDWDEFLQSMSNQLSV
ncbi:uncharacterized protein Z518_00167 [Rhinocladiella mackenziei CBS 650.93]|uniref:Uncharacterized protein n=1 Tax=Rhinocladiella mackenziei CBS 650.93 TaxID=1442369 RepID=A0A0D2ISX0_9EURO|nr:uncharacterized protein Z518_00167 [Rhinocladiella mackenziei CBS 650.93]KIX09089.1 hypothetical protein Z518_00167 [Rhinocladiella mackenziei CBS 650.93]